MMRSTGHKGKGKKGQIALEFIIVYSFVLVIFLVIFALIAAQRASTLSAQQFSSLELITQNIATNIDHALAAGSGYTATIPIVGSISALPYNLYISSTGVVLANMTIGKQEISADAYSSARSISVNATFASIAANGIAVYTIPIYTGTIHISNSKGTIYIDQNPISVAGLPMSMNVGTLVSNGSQSVPPIVSLEAASFNGNSYISDKNMSGLSGNTISETAWVYMLPTTQQYSGILYYGPQTNGGTTFAAYMQSTGIPGLSDWGNDFAPSGSGSFNTWNFVAFTQNGSNIVLYYNNQKFTGTLSFPGTPSNSYMSIGQGQIGAGQMFHGLLADVQLYNTTLSANDIQALYQEGIGGAPIEAQNLAGWWPLGGNAQDYSGNGNTGEPNNITYSNVAQIAAKEFSGSGKPASDALVGLASSNGYLNGNNHAIGMYTDANGTAVSYISSNSSSGIANVTINGFNGNLSTVGNLVAWFPLDLGYGNATYSMVNNITGNFENPSWESIPGNSSSIFAGTFDGSNSIVNTTFSVPVAASGITISAWVDNNGKGTYWQNIAEISGEPYTHETLGIGVTGSGGNAVMRWSNYANTFADQPAGGTVPPNTLELVTGVWSGFNNTLSVYINGNLVATATGNDTGLTAIRELNIGGAYPGMYNFNGSISNVQVYNSSLSQVQVRSLYSEGISGTPIGSAGLQAWYPLDGNINDYSNYNHAAIAKNITFTSTESYQNSSASKYVVADFNGASTKIQTNLSFPASNTENFTFAGWVYPTLPQPNNPGGIVDADNGTNGWGLYYFTGNPGYYDFWIDGQGYTQDMTFGRVYPNQWNFVAITYSDKSGSIYANGYVDGVNVDSDIHRALILMPLPFDAEIGQIRQSSSYMFSGKLSDLQFYNNTLSTTQIEQLYQQGLPFYKKVNISV